MLPRALILHERLREDTDLIGSSQYYSQIKIIRIKNIYWYMLESRAEHWLIALGLSMTLYARSRKIISYFEVEQVTKNQQKKYINTSTINISVSVLLSCLLHQALRMAFQAITRKTI